MAHASFTAFLQALEGAGELRRVRGPVATELEITEFADREMKAPGGGKALLFERPTVDGRPSAFPVAINTMGSERRLALALGVESLAAVAARVEGLLQARPPATLREGWELLRRGLDLLHVRPRRVAAGPCQEVIHRYDGEAGANAGGDASGGRGHGGTPDFSLASLPVLKCWPRDGGRFFTLPCVHTRDPGSGARNVGMYRMQVYGPLETGMHWQVHKVAARHGRTYYERGEPMPVAVTLGGDPAVTLAATAPLPDGVDELMFAGFLRRRAVELVRCVTVDLEVPADADFVIEGRVQPGELRPEGPFGDHTGYYTAVEDYPVFRVTAISHRRAAVYPATVVGIPPMEDYYLGDASVRIFLPVFRATFPEIRDLALPAAGVFHNLAVVSIRKQYPWQAYKVMHGLWGMGQMMFAKYIVVVDDDCDVRNIEEVLFRLCANTDPERDSTFVKNPSDALDHAPAVQNIGSHMGIDATRKVPGEGHARPWPELVRMTPEVRRRVDALVAELGGR